MTRRVRLGEVGTGVAIAMSVATMAMTLIDRTTSSAQSAEALASRVKLAEANLQRHEALLQGRGRFVSDATYQLNYLCTTSAECRRIYAPIAVPE